MQLAAAYNWDSLEAPQQKAMKLLHPLLHLFLLHNTHSRN
jgi:hypothetical protein